jgi:predicted nucleotide-binding protein
MRPPLDKPMDTSLKYAAYKSLEAYMSLPIRTTVEDIAAICGYLVKKPMGATPTEARTVLDPKYLDGRKISAYKFWNLIDEAQDGRLKISENGRNIIKGPGEKVAGLRKIIDGNTPYRAIVERALHRQENSITATDVAAHWHQHFAKDVSENEKTLNDQAVCFFQLAEGAEIGTLIVGRRGAPTRFEFDLSKVAGFLDGHEITRGDSTSQSTPLAEQPGKLESASPISEDHPTTAPAGDSLGQAIFIAHGKNKKPLEQLKKILEQFKIPYKVAVEEPNLGRPIGVKVQEIMRSCNCAILVFTADEEFQNSDGKTIWRPSENVVYELGATGYLYGSRLVIMKEDSVDFPTNFRDLGYINFAKDNLDAKAMDVLKELIGFGIVKITT